MGIPMGKFVDRFSLGISGSARDIDEQKHLENLLRM
jgi:hypothetical protein